MKSRRKSTFVRPEQRLVEVSKLCSTRTAVTLEAIAGCALAGNLGISPVAIPTGTFNGNTL